MAGAQRQYKMMTQDIRMTVMLLFYKVYTLLISRYFNNFKFFLENQPILLF